MSNAPHRSISKAKLLRNKQWRVAKFLRPLPPQIALEQVKIPYFRLKFYDISSKIPILHVGYAAIEWFHFSSNLCFLR